MEESSSIYFINEPILFYLIHGNDVYPRRWRGATSVIPTFPVNPVHEPGQEPDVLVPLGVVIVVDPSGSVREISKPAV